MKFTLSWLKNHLDTDASVQTIAEKLTAIGLEVEEITNPADALRPFKVAKILSAEKHPKADKLQVLNVDAGDGPIQVVCGAPNARAGLRGVFGEPGTYIPGSGFTLGQATIRDIESNGMMCSARELELGEDHDGIIELPEDAPIGASYIDYAKLDDPLFDVAVTPNRPDCFGIAGIARDLAAAGLGVYKNKPMTYDVISGNFDPEVNVSVEPESGCYVFWRRIIRGVSNGPSPKWLQQQLKAVGLRPISALVDVTNFFAMDQARPLHVYDIAKLTGNITVRRGREGESFHALNDKHYSPGPQDCVIADDSGAIGLGGIVGGQSTGVDEDTIDVLLECAWFDPETIAKTGQRLNVSTDARMRFERGIDPMLMEAAMQTAAQMIIDFCGGEASQPEMSGTYPEDKYPNQADVVVYDPALLQKLVGFTLPVSEQVEILNRLGFSLIDAADSRSWPDQTQRKHVAHRLAQSPKDSCAILVPTWRPDIDGPEDLVEEVARIIGYDEVPSTALPREEGVAHAVASRAQIAERRLRRAAAARGLNETITWSFISEEQAAHFGGGTHVLSNPISEDMKVMRPSLLPGLAAAARRNLDRGADSVRLFELGRRYLAEGEKPTATILLTGDKKRRGWQHGKASAFDAFDAKAEAMALLEAAGAPVANLQLFMGAGDHWHPGRSAKLGLGPKKVLARFGELHPSLAKALDLPAATVVAELYLDAIPAPRSNDRARVQYAPPALQPVIRDFAFIVPDDLAAADLERFIAGADKKRIVNVRTFDRFEGKDGLSLAVEVTLQPQDKSFTDEEIGAISQAVIAAAQKKGATLRG